jgi:hypothetical protein
MATAPIAETTTPISHMAMVPIPETIAAPIPPPVPDQSSSFTPSAQNSVLRHRRPPQKGTQRDIITRPPDLHSRSLWSQIQRIVKKQTGVPQSFRYSLMLSIFDSEWSQSLVFFLVAGRRPKQSGAVTAVGFSEQPADRSPHPLRVLRLSYSSSVDLRSSKSNFMRIVRS